MYKVIIFIGLLLTHVSHGSGFIQEDLRGIFTIKRSYLCSYNNDHQYQKTFGEAWTVDPAQVFSFRLKSGVDVAVTYNVLMNLKEENLAIQADGASAAPFRPALSAEFQDFPLPAEYMTDPNTPFTIQMCKKYGMICNEKFDRGDKISIKLALSRPGKTVLIKDGHYKVSVCEASLPQMDYFKKLVLGPNTLGFGLDADLKIIFRHLSPNNEPNNYALFLHTKNIYNGDLGQEELLGSFTGEEISKPL